MRNASLALLIAPHVVAGAAVAQDAAPPETGSVTVTGERLTREARRDRAEALVRQTGIAFGEQPASRWLDPICLKVIGLPSASAEEVAGRIRTIASEAGARLAKAPCRANAVIAFVADGAATVRQVASQRGGSLQEVAPHARKALETGDAPIRWWYSTKPRGKDGMGPDGSQAGNIGGESNAAATGHSGASSPGQTLPGNMDTTFQTVRGTGFISTEVVRAIHAANVIVDVKRLQGVGLDAVADYAAFVTLAEVRMTAQPNPDSILGLFAPPTPARRLTTWDSAILATLYRMPLDRTARMQRGLLTSALVAASEGRSKQRKP